MMYSRILVPVDGSETALRGLQEAAKVAKSCGGKVQLLHVVNEFVIDTGYAPVLYNEQLVHTLRENGKKVLASAQAAAHELGLEAESKLVEVIGGRAADEIVKQAVQWPAELIVIGTHGRRGLRRLAMGSDAELVLRSSPVPVLMVRSEAEAV